VTERELEQLNQGRVLRDASQALLPLLHSMKTGVIGRTVAHFRAGETEKLITLAAELSVITELETKLTQNNAVTAAREGKLHGN